MNQSLLNGITVWFGVKMTRINVIHPSLLVRQHLVAEYRELPRIYALVRDAIARGETIEQARAKSSPTYTLNTGHCRFFYTRLGWLTDRFLGLVEEMQARGYNVTHTTIPEWTGAIPSGWFGQWRVTPEAELINIERINTRLIGMGLSDRRILI